MAQPAVAKNVTFALSLYDFNVLLFGANDRSTEEMEVKKIHLL